jgi:hypothetical protein
MLPAYSVAQVILPVIGLAPARCWRFCFPGAFFGTLSPLFATLTDTLMTKSFICHSYRKHRGWGRRSTMIFRAPLRTHSSTGNSIIFMGIHHDSLDTPGYPSGQAFPCRAIANRAPAANPTPVRQPLRAYLSTARSPRLDARKSPSDNFRQRSRSFVDALAASPV